MKFTGQGVLYIGNEAIGMAGRAEFIAHSKPIQVVSIEEESQPEPKENPFSNTESIFRVKNYHPGLYSIFNPRFKVKPEPVFGLTKAQKKRRKAAKAARKARKQNRR